MSKDLVEAARLIHEEIKWADTHQDEEAVAGLVAALNIVEDLITLRGLEAAKEVAGQS
jgi:hypothetical protein